MLFVLGKRKDHVETGDTLHRCLELEQRVLADLGSEHFERLSSGRYRFSADGEFLNAHFGELHRPDLDKIEDVLARLDAGEIDTDTAREALEL